LSLALQADPTYVAARVTRADVLRQSGRTGESLAEYQRALEAEPALASAQFGAGLALASLGRYPEARGALTQAASDHPGDRSLTVALARVLAAAPEAGVRDPNRALTILEPVVRTEASFDAVETMARAFAELGRFDEAASIQQQAVTQARSTGEVALADAMADTARLYQQRRVPRGLWRAEPLYEPTP
jgi:tetratricopeptide (TPR) repeat protein